MEVQERPEPVPESHQVLVDVEYAGVVFPDVLQTRGLYQRRPDVPFTPGWEVSGVVRAITHWLRDGHGPSGGGVSAGGRHLHHYNLGILMLSGLGAVARRRVAGVRPGR